MFCSVNCVFHLYFIDIFCYFVSFMLLCPSDIMYYLMALFCSFCTIGVVLLLVCFICAVLLILCLICGAVLILRFIDSVLLSFYFICDVLLC